MAQNNGVIPPVVVAAAVIHAPLPGTVPKHVQNSDLGTSHLLKLLEKSAGSAVTVPPVTDADMDLDIESIAGRCKEAAAHVSGWMDDALTAAKNPRNAGVPVRFEYGFVFHKEEDGEEGGIICFGKSYMRSAVVDYRTGPGRSVAVPSWMTLELETECEFFSLPCHDDKQEPKSIEL